MSSKNYSSLFRPARIGNMTLKNRIVMSPMTTRLADPGHGVSERMIDYFEARARGGAAMVTTEAFYVASRFGALNTVNLDSPEKIPGLAALAEAVHAWDCRLCVQLGCGLGRYGLFDRDGNPPKTSSAIPTFAKPDTLCQEMTKAEIAKVVKEYGKAAGRAVKAGADAINIHGHNGYLIDQFMSAQFNTRTDEYGGSVENRMRYANEIVQSIRASVGPDIPIIFRFSVDLKFPGSRDLEETMEMLRILQDSGIDALDLDTGATESMDWIFIPYYWGEGCALFVAEEAKKHGITLPILTSGCNNPDVAADAVENGILDFAMFGRSLIADPDMPVKLMQNRAVQIRPCLRCNQYCTKRSINDNSYVTCAGNAAAGNERRFALSPDNSANSKAVVVVGGGPAGMEAARVAALKGCHVTLYEKDAELGGILRHARYLRFKETFDFFLKWQKNELGRLGVSIETNKAIYADSPELCVADTVFLATGAKRIPPQVEGISCAESIYETDPAGFSGKNIIMLDNTLDSCEYALALALAGASVTILSKDKKFAPEAYGINRRALLKLLKTNHVKMLSSRTILRITSGHVTISSADLGEETLQADTLLYAGKPETDRQYINAFSRSIGERVCVIGTCESGATVGDAVRSAYFASRRLFN